VNGVKLYSDLQKAKKPLPDGGQWVTMHGHHVYIKDGKVLAGKKSGMTEGGEKPKKLQEPKRTRKPKPTAEAPAGHYTDRLADHAIPTDKEKEHYKKFRNAFREAYKEKPYAKTMRSHGRTDK
jgi:hypothetical protein